MTQRKNRDEIRIKWNEIHCCRKPVIVSKDVIDNMNTEDVEFISLGDVNVKGFVNVLGICRLME